MIVSERKNMSNDYPNSCQLISVNLIIDRSPHCIRCTCVNCKNIWFWKTCSRVSCARILICKVLTLYDCSKSRKRFSFSTTSSSSRRPWGHQHNNIHYSCRFWAAGGGDEGLRAVPAEQLCQTARQTPRTDSSETDAGSPRYFVRRPRREETKHLSPACWRKTALLQRRNGTLWCLSCQTHFKVTTMKRHNNTEDLESY